MFPVRIWKVTVSGERIRPGGDMTGSTPTNPARPADAAQSLARLRQLCLDLPETTERPSHGEPTWFVRDKKVFVMFADRHHDDRVACWCAAPPGAAEALIAADPEHYFRPPYVGGRGWLGIYLDVPLDWAEVRELVRDGYRVVAPRRLAAALDD
jgi:hypothetical protein